MESVGLRCLWFERGDKAAAPSRCLLPMEEEEGPARSAGLAVAPSRADAAATRLAVVPAAGRDVAL